MGDKSNISWTDATWNPVTGCSKVSPGCAHCYAETISLRFGFSKKPWTPENAAENVVLHADRLNQPLSWRKPRRVFVNSMSDLFHELVPDRFIDRVFAAMAMTPRHTYQVLTKRPERMLAYLAADHRHPQVEEEYDALFNRVTGLGTFLGEWPLPNVWLGVSVENQRWADERIPPLLATPAAVRFVSAEPLLGGVDLSVGLRRCTCGRVESHAETCAVLGPRLDWVIIGGESGPGARVMERAWARSLLRQCREAGVAPFVKQLGGPRAGGALEDMPEDLRVREWPR